MDEKDYPVEEYWSDVANRIASRSNDSVVAGDDEPFYDYKRERFLKLLHSVHFTGKKVLEVGSGPGGNLMEVWKHQPALLYGADISADMIRLASGRVPADIKFVKTDGGSLPFEDRFFDIVFTATVLQHNTNQETLGKLVSEICRVSGSQVYLFERIESSLKGDVLNHGRPVSFYENLMRQHGFTLAHHKFINIQTSYMMAGATRKLLNSKNRKEGEPLSKVSIMVQKAFMPLTRVLDKIFKAERDLAMMCFERKG